jgi:hypothetical protein
MTMPDSLEQLPTNGTRSRVYGEPYRTADGATVIPVSRVRPGSATPLGVFVIHGGKAQWTGAVNSDRLALIGVLSGLIAAALGSAAVLRRPPWPDLSATSEAWSQRR